MNEFLYRLLIPDVTQKLDLQRFGEKSLLDIIFERSPMLLYVTPFMQKKRTAILLEIRCRLLLFCSTLSYYTIACRNGNGIKRQTCKLQVCQWWTIWGSNPRPQRCERCALPAELIARIGGI